MAAAAKAWLPRVRLTGSSSWDDELNYSDLGSTLRALAAIWSDHPDYDPAWA